MDHHFEEGPRMAGSATRTRDPDRKDKILAAATDLIGTHGFSCVSMTDIGKQAGITGSGIYRHFSSKATILVHLFEQIIDGLNAGQESVLSGAPTPVVALGQLVDRQVAFVVDQRELARVYYNEVDNLPREDRSRLRDKQRRYLEHWIRLVDEARPDLDLDESRTVVHAAIGAIQSPLFHRVDLDDARLRAQLRTGAMAVLALPDAKGCRP
ncbi:MAG: TetR/AcrR family transcriptional regulator [Lapillicoccus sp.]